MFRKKRHWIAFSLLAGILGILAFRISDKYFEMAKSLDIMASVYRDLNSYYVDSVDPAELMNAGIMAMTISLDPYTHFYSEAELDELDFQTTGTYAGVGASFRQIRDSVLVTGVYPGAPFEKAKVIPGDFIISLNGISAGGLSQGEVSSLLKGESGSIIEVLLYRPWTNKLIKKKIIRDEVSFPDIAYAGILKNDIGYIRMTQFIKGSAEDVAKAFNNLKNKNKHLKGLILDLRSNPGGLLSEAVKISNFFLPVGDTIVSIKGRVNTWNHVYTATAQPMDTLIPLAILINHSSASASEIVAGAMQDRDRAIIVGQPSFGKGLVQITRELPYHSKIKITTARYYTPSGRCIQAIDYSNRDENGQGSPIPDSLEKTFKTNDGRLVKDQGGIYPDKVVSDEYLSNMATTLLNRNLIFDFATTYYYQHPEPPSPDSFSLSDETFNKFKKFIANQNITYETRSERTLTYFKALAEQEGYFDSVKTAYQVLAQKINQYKPKDLSENETEIKQLISEEIMSRYYAQEGRITVKSANDMVIDSATSLLHQSSQYQLILHTTGPIANCRISKIKGQISK